MRSWNSEENKDAVIIRYAIRLILPFLFWALFYAIVPPFVSGEPDGILNAIKTHLLNILLHPREFAFYGFVYHLWFLSSLFQALLILSVCLRYGNLLYAVVMGAIYYGIELLGGLYAVAPWGFHTNFDMKEGPFISTLFVAMGALIAQHSYMMRPVKALTLACIGFLLALAEIWFLHAYYQRPWMSYNYTLGTSIFGLGVMFLALSWRNVNTGLAYMGTYSLGIYAIHPYIIEVLKRLGIDHLLISFPLIFISIAFIVSLFLAILLAKIKWMRRMVV